MPDRPIALNLAVIVHRLLTNPRGWEVADLRRTLGIKGRTWRKYKRLLRDEYPYAVGEPNLVLREVVEGDRTFLRLGAPDEGELSQIIPPMTAHHLAAEVFRFLGDSELRAAVNRAYADFRARLPNRRYLAHVFRNLDRILHCVPDAPKDYSGRQDTIEQILRALVFTRRLRMTYEATTGTGEHEIEPLTLALYRSSLYLFARYAGHDRVYNFAVDRIRELELLTSHFTYPAEKEYTPEKYTEDGFGIFVPRVKKRVAVEVVFADEPWLKKSVRERRWSKTQRFQDLPDGRLRMTFRASSLVEVKPWILQFGDLVEVVKPPRAVLMSITADEGRGAGIQPASESSG